MKDSLKDSSAVSTFRCIVFDMDGTLVQTNQLIFESFNYVTQKYVKKRYTDSEIIALFGPPEEDVIERLVGKEHLNEAIIDYLSFYRMNHKRLAKVHSGMSEVLQYCKEIGLIVSLFTGKGKKTTNITLEEYALDNHFDIIVTGDDVKNHKPSADGLKLIMERTGLSPEQLLMVGDSPADICAAREGGVRIASVLWDSYAADTVLQLQPDFVFYSVSDFYQWLKQNV